MTRRIALLAAFVMVASVATTVAPAASEADWIVATVIAGPDDATDVRLQVTAEGTNRNAQPSAFGVGWGSATGWVASLLSSRQSRTALRTTADLGGVDIEAVPPTSDGAGFSVMIGFGTLRAYQWRRVLVFATDIRFVPQLTWSTTSGSISVTMATGTGSRAYELADANGVGANVGYSAAGDITLRDTVSTGIVGAIDWPCEACIGSWTDPDGQTRRFSSMTAIGTGYAGRGSPSFAGPAGSWTWRWTGARPYLWGLPVLGRHALVAYAPIGDLAIPPPKGIPGPRSCGDNDVVGSVSCSFVQGGENLYVFAQSQGGESSTVRAIAPDGSVIAECSTSADPLAHCSEQVPDVSVPPGSIIRCELEGVLTSGYACAGWTNTPPQDG